MQNGVLFLHTHEGVHASQKYGKPDEHKARKQHYSGANIEQMLTKAYGGSKWRVSKFTNLDLEEIFAAFSAVAVRHANVFTACFLRFHRFPAAPLQLATPACMRNHFQGLYCGNTLSLRPARTTVRHKSWPERHLQWEEQWHGECKSRPGHGDTIK